MVCIPHSVHIDVRPRKCESVGTVQGLTASQGLDT